MRVARIAFPAVCLAVAVAAPYFVGGSANQALLVTTVIVAIAALGLDVVIGHMGQFSFGHAAFWGIGAYATTKFSLALGFPVVLALLASTVLTGVVGLLVGFVVMRRNRALELAMVTLGFSVLLDSVANNWQSFTGGEGGIFGIAPLRLGSTAYTSAVGQYFFCLVILVAVAYVLHRISHSRSGRAIHSLREGEYLAASIGVRVTPYYAMSFAVGAALGGLAGALYAHTQLFVAPGLFDLSYMFEFLIVVMIGGRGTIGGPILGATIYVWVNQWAANISQSGRLLMFGVILLVVSLTLPQGIYPALRSALASIVGHVGSASGGGSSSSSGSSASVATSPLSTASESRSP
jgi:branched-chain amino acid transport system permease protein